MQDEIPQPLKLTAADLFPASKQEADIVPEVYQAHAPRDTDSDYEASTPKPVARIMPKPQVTEQGPAKVLHVRVVTGCGGGPEKTILRSPRYADPNRYQMAAAYIYPQGDPGMCVIREIAKSLKCPLYEVSESHALDHNTIGAMIELCRDLKVDIWHGHDYKSNLFGLIVKRFHPMKLVTTAHGFTRETWRTRLYYHLDNLAMLGYDQTLAVSPQLVKHCAYHGVNPDRLTYIPNAIDTAEYVRTQSTSVAKTEFGLAQDKFMIGVIGRLSPEKGTDRAIRMLPELLAAHPNTELHLIGDGHERGALQQLASQLGVLDAIRWWGWQTDTRPFYEMLDALLLPSRTEGLPNVVLEAMAMGVPVAATNVGGVSDLLDSGDCGIILSDDETDWAKQIAPLLSIPTLRESYADLAHRRVSGAFNFRNRIRAVMSVYDQALGRFTPNTSASADHSVNTAAPTRIAA
jgi:glycosyltransferase involved in cell wall biosynthesis